MKSYTKFTEIWIAKHGALPKYYEIIHLDGDHKNNNFSNLVIVGSK